MPVFQHNEINTTMKLFNPFIRWLRPQEPVINPPIINEDIQMTTQFAEAFSKFAPSVARHVNEFIPILIAGNINTPLRLAHFLAQAGHESAKFSLISEGLSYRADVLHSMFRKHFPTMELANRFARKPEATANVMYANRMGNGDSASGDGYRFRGRGYIQLTGKNNYRAYSMYRFGDERILKNPDMLLDPVEAIRSAVWFWETNKLNVHADKDDVLAVSRAVNLGSATSSKTPHGMEDRRAKLTQIKSLLKL